MGKKPIKKEVKNWGRKKWMEGVRGDEERMSERKNGESRKSEEGIRRREL